MSKLTLISYSNTKVALFQSFATAVEPFRTVIENTPKPNAFTRLAKLDQEQTCHLSYAADMIRSLTDGLIKMDQVQACRGFVTAANLDSTVSQSSLFWRDLEMWSSIPTYTNSRRQQLSTSKANQLAFQ